MIGFVKVIGAGIVGSIVGTLMTKSSNNKKYDAIVDEYVDACLDAYIVAGIRKVDLKAYLYNIIPGDTGYPVNKIFKDVVDRAEKILHTRIV